MSIEKRRFIRFSLDIPAFRFTKENMPTEIMVRQISIGGCLAELDENILTGDEFRLEFTLPNKNRLPLYGKAIYQFAEKGIGIKFNDITQFEQELLGKIISDSLETEGLPLLVDPFTQPRRMERKDAEPVNEALAKKIKEDELVEEVIATEF